MIVLIFQDGIRRFIIYGWNFGILIINSAFNIVICGWQYLNQFVCLLQNRLKWYLYNLGCDNQRHVYRGKRERAYRWYTLNNLKQENKKCQDTISILEQSEINNTGTINKLKDEIVSLNKIINDQTFIMSIKDTVKTGGGIALKPVVFTPRSGEACPQIEKISEMYYQRSAEVAFRLW